MDVDVIDTIPIIDADTHLLEPGDLFTSRVAKKFVDRVPQLKWVEEAGNEAWFVGERRIGGGVFSMAGYDAYPPDFPPRLFDSPKENWDAKTRAARMDRYGIQAEVLYPNVTLFYSDAVSDSGQEHATPDRLRSGLQRLPNGLCRGSPGSVRADHHAPVLRPRRLLGRDQALCRSRPQGDRVLTGAELLRPAVPGERPLGSAVGAGPGHGVVDQLPHRAAGRWVRLRRSGSHHGETRRVRLGRLPARS